MKSDKNLNTQKENWEKETLDPVLSRFPERRGQFITTSSEPIDRLYTPLDLPDFEYESDLGFPGEYPYTRGIHPTMHRGRLWTMRMFAGFGTAEETNQRFKYLLDQGHERIGFIKGHPDHVASQDRLRDTVTGTVRCG